MAVSDNIADRLVAHDVDLLRFEAGLQRRVLALLRDLERKLVDQLVVDDPTAPVRTSFQRRRLTRLLEEVQQLLRRGYLDVHRMTRQEFIGLAAFEQSAVAGIINAEIGVNLVRSGLTQERLRALVDDTFISGGATQADTIKNWWARQSATFHRRMADTVRQGMLQDETVQQLVRRVRGTRAARFRDGVFAMSRRDAATLVRTAVIGVSNTVRDRVYRDNNDVIRGLAASVTLDSRTSEICIARSGAAWDVLTGRPLPGSTRQEPYPGPTPWHFNCRTSLVPVTRSHAEILRQQLGVRADRELRRLPRAQRELLTRTLPREKTYPEWLREQSESRQRAILGPLRWQRWQDGKLNLHDLIDQSGHPRTLAQLNAL